MTIAQKMLDERRIGYLDGVEEGIEKGMKKGMEKGLEKGLEKGVEKGLKMAVASLKGIVEPAVIAERFKMPLEQVMDILNCN